MFSSNIQRNHSSKLLIKIQLYIKCSFNLISVSWTAWVSDMNETDTWGYYRTYWVKNQTVMMTKTFTRKPFTQKVFPLKNVRRQEHGMKKTQGLWIRRCFLKMQCLYVFTAKESVVNNVNLVHVYTEKLLSRMQKHVLCEWPCKQWR